MLFLAKTLSFYKRTDIQEELVKQAKDKEVAFRFDETFGKRPEMLNYPNDVLELAKQRITSFHCSEELWKNPLQLNTGMKREELNALRKGWDLVFDIDCPNWDLSRITTWLVIKALRAHGISSIYVKFSGNKGFHIALPFEIFPEKIADVSVKDMFPEFATKAMLYVLDFITQNYIPVENNEVKFYDDNHKYTVEELSRLLNKNFEDITYLYCESCKKRVEVRREERKELIVTSQDSDFITPASEKDTKKIILEGKMCDCQKPRYKKLFNPFVILNIDAILISSRHLYRMPYSFHEKSHLISIPINPDDVLHFNKDDAKPENVTMKHPFLERQGKSSQEGLKFWQNVFDYKSFMNKEKMEEMDLQKKFNQPDIIHSLPEKAIGEESFPPCIKLIFQGLEDGRKRSCFVLINFLISCGWEYDLIEKRLLEWNEKNTEPLRPQYILGQLRYTQQSRKVLPPPNCNNLSYYKSFSVCKPDELCRQVKNPLQYAKRKEKSKPVQRAKPTRKKRTKEEPTDSGSE